MPAGTVPSGKSFKSTTEASTRGSLDQYLEAERASWYSSNSPLVRVSNQQLKLVPGSCLICTRRLNMPPGTD